MLDSLGIRPDLVVGSSMGAIIGGMYASGYSGREIDSLARALPIADLFRTYQPRAPRSLGLLQPLVVWEQGARRFTIQSAAVDEAEVNALVNGAMLRGNLLARGNFDSLPIPFRAVAADLADRTAVVLATGDLARAVRASFAIPLVFAPESLDGRILADGGLAANIPIAVARAAGSRTGHRLGRHRAPGRFARPVLAHRLADRLLGFLFRAAGRFAGPGGRPGPAGGRGIHQPQLFRGQRGPADPTRHWRGRHHPPQGALSSTAALPRRGRCCHAGSLAWRSRQPTPRSGSRSAASWVWD